MIVHHNNTVPYCKALMMNKLNLFLNRMQAIDGALCVKVSHTGQYRFIRHFFRLVSRLGDGVFWYTLLLAILLVQGWEVAGSVLHILLTGLSGTLVYKWLKGKTQRPRPYQVLQDVWMTGKPLDYFSFPSGHTLHAVIFCLMTIAYFPALASLVIVFSVLVGMSRVVLGLHYPSDVLAGAMIGAVMSIVSLSLF